MGLSDYLGNDRFLDVPRLIQKDKLGEAFPGLLPDQERVVAQDFPWVVDGEYVYLDSGSTSLEPASIISQIAEYKLKHMRGSDHSEGKVAAKAATGLNHTRELLRQFFGAQDFWTPFTPGTTGSSNTLGIRFDYKPGDLIFFTSSEHNSQRATQRGFAKLWNRMFTLEGLSGVDFGYVPINQEGRLDLEYLGNVISEKKQGRVLLYLIHISNFSGVINPIKQISGMFKAELNERGMIYLDIAQSAGHMPISLNELGVHYGGISAHKMYGPQGIGAFFIKKGYEEHLTDLLSGGNAVKFNTDNHLVPADMPQRLEPGTQNIEGAIEWRMAIEWLMNIGMDKVEAHDTAIGKYLLQELQKINGLDLYGPKEYKERAGVISVNIGPAELRNYNEVASRLYDARIFVRQGPFCADALVDQLLGTGFCEYVDRQMETGQPVDMSQKPGAVRATSALYVTPMHAYKYVKTLDRIAKEILAN